jgi:hypothetical protein
MTAGLQRLASYPALADFVASLTAEQRQRLASLLTGKPEGGDNT